MKLRAPIIALVLFTNTYLLWSQQPNVRYSSFLERYQAYRELLPLEKLYVHIDQTSYYPGEDMHFAIHVLNGMTNQYDSALSVTAYLEVIDASDSILHRKAIRLDNGRSYGTLGLDSLESNRVYRLRAYTHWMRNLGAEGYYEQPFAITEPDMSASLDIPTIDTKHLVASAQSRLDLSNPKWMQLQFNPSNAKDDDCLIIIESQQHIAYSAVMPFQGGVGEAAIQKSKIPVGYFRLVLMNKEMAVIDELVAFNDYQYLDFELDATGASQVKRSKQDRVLTIYDQNNEPVQGQFSVAVRHKGGSDISRWSMQDYFGTRYQNANHTGARSDIQWLDLSEGFNLDELEEYQYMERTMAIGGLAKRPNGKPSVSSDLNMFINTKVPFYTQAKTDRKGLFVMDNLYFEDKADIVLSESKKKPLDFTIYPLWPKPAPVRAIDWNTSIKPRALDEPNDLTINFDEVFKLQADDIILEEVEIKASKEREDIRRGVARLYGNADYTIDDSRVNFNSGIYANVFQIIAGRVSSYIPPPAGGPGGMFRRVSSTSNTVPLCLLNGVPTNCESLGNIPVQLISSIDVTPKAQVIFGGMGANGMIAVYTIAAEPNEIPDREINSTAHTFSLEGYHPQDLPEMPDYSTKLPQHIRPDYRSTLFWNPNMATDTSGQVNLSFYMNDLPDLNYVIEVEGVDDKGRFVSLEVPLFGKESQ